MNFQGNIWLTPRHSQRNVRIEDKEMRDMMCDLLRKKYRDKKKKMQKLNER